MQVFSMFKMYQKGEVGANVEFERLQGETYWFIVLCLLTNELSRGWQMTPPTSSSLKKPLLVVETFSNVICFLRHTCTCVCIYWQVF